MLHVTPHALKWLAALAALAVSGASPAEAADAADASRYPYDPACAWGRVADGRGMLVRCMTQTEAQGLLAHRASAPAPGQANPEKEPKDRPEAKERRAQEMTASIAPAVADSGSLPEAHKKLRTARDRFEQCVAKHGGLDPEGGEVHVRFLVRERGRAEGVSVKKRSGMSAEAAQCVAEVVDRRAVGFPEAPMVGATIVVSFKAK